MGSNYMLIGRNVAIEPLVGGGYAVLVNGEHWRENEEDEHPAAFDSPLLAEAAYHRHNPGDTGLGDMARDMVGDGKNPNLYFVTVDGTVRAAFGEAGVECWEPERRREFTGPALERAKAYAQQSFGAPSALEYPVQIEDRLNGLVWENAASIAEQETEEEGDDRCPHTHGGRHVLDDFVQKADCDAADSKSIVVDVSCRACGRSGSVTISPDDVQW